MFNLHPELNMPLSNPVQLKESIATRIMLIVFLNYVLITVVLTFIHLYAEYNSTRERVFQRLRLFESTFNPALATAMWAVNDELLFSTLQGMMKNPILKGVKVEDKKELNYVKGIGTVINENGQYLNLAGDRETVTNRQFGLDMFSYRFDVVYKDQNRQLKLGVCTVYSSVSVVLEEVRLEVIFVVINAILKSIALWMVYLIVSRNMLSKPLSQLIRSAREIKLANLEHFRLHVKTKGKNELTVLQEAFHFMVNNLLTARRRLERNLQISERFSHEGRKISSCMTYDQLAEQVALSFSRIADREIDCQLVYLSRPQTGKGETDVSDDLPLNKPPLPLQASASRTILAIPDTKTNQLLGNVIFRNLGEDEEEMLPLFKALLVNIANTMNIIAMVRELEQKADDLQASNRALSRLDKLKDEFLANTSHELRTPLNGIIGMSETLIDGVAGTLTLKQKQFLAMIVRSGKSLSNLIDDLLDFSKMSNRALHLELEHLSLNHIIDTVLTFFKPLMVQKNLTLQNEIPEGLPFVHADENRLQQVLFNILGNAVKFTDQGKISIAAESEQDLLRVLVRDTGIGIGKDKLDRIFNPFEQSFDPAMGKFGGTGLGLAISRHLIELHGGKMTVESLEGVGSIFSFTLPISKTVSPPPTLSPEKTLPSIASRFHRLLIADTPVFPQNEWPGRQKAAREEIILAVDDDPLNLQVIKNYLQINGFKTLLATNGQQALEIYKQESIDLVLLDLMMPVLNGYDTCRAIRQHCDLASLPIIMLTAKNQVGDLVQGFEAGANDYILKPFLKEELLARVETHLNAKKTVASLKEVKNLKKEIEQRKQAEKELLLSQKRLLRILDLSDSALIAMNDSLRIIFFNHGAETLFDFSSNSRINQPVRSILSAAAWEKVKKALSAFETCSGKPVASFHLEIRRADGLELPLPGTLMKLQSSSDRIFALLIHQSGVNRHYGFYPAMPDCTLPLSQHDALQLKTHALEEAISEVSPIFAKESGSLIYDLRYFGTFFEEMPKALADEKIGLKTRKALVDIMRCSLVCWENQVGKTKIDLAEESNIWRVYLDSGTYRTRTLDKYFSLDTLPRYPKWKDVVSTAIFVLKESPTQGAQKTQLIASIEKLSCLLTEEPVL